MCLCWVLTNAHVNPYHNIEHSYQSRKFPHVPFPSIPDPVLQKPSLFWLFYHRLFFPRIPEFHINGIRQFEIFCVRVLSLSMMILQCIHVSARIGESSFYCWEVLHCLNIARFAYPLMDIWAFSRICKLWRELHWILSFKPFCEFGYLFAVSIDMSCYL